MHRPHRVLQEGWAGRALCIPTTPPLGSFTPFPFPAPLPGLYFPRSAFGADGSSLLSLPSSRSTKGNWPGRDGRHAPAGTNTEKRRGLRVASVKVAQSCPTLCDPVDSTIHGILQARILEWGAFPFPSNGSSQLRDRTQVSPIAGGILYQLSHQESPRILEWVAYPFSRGSSLPRNQTGVSCIADIFFTSQRPGSL